MRFPFRHLRRAEGEPGPGAFAPGSSAHAKAFSELTKLRERLDLLQTTERSECPALFLKPQGLSIRRGTGASPSKTVELAFEGDYLPLEAVMKDVATARRRFSSCGASLATHGMTFDALKQLLRDALSALYCLHLAGYAHGAIGPSSLAVRCAPNGQLRALLLGYDGLTMLPSEARKAATLMGNDLADLLSRVEALLTLRVPKGSARRESRRLLLFFLWKKNRVFADAYKSCLAKEGQSCKALFERFIRTLDAWADGLDPPEREKLASFNAALTSLPREELNLLSLRPSRSPTPTAAAKDVIDLTAFRDAGSDSSDTESEAGDAESDPSLERIDLRPQRVHFMDLRRHRRIR
jgi:hypothetical protein